MARRVRERGRSGGRRRQDTVGSSLSERSVARADSEPPTVDDRRSTGLPALDRALGGGVPAGSLVALTADPASQSELVVRAFAAVHETRYLTTVRSADSVAHWLGESTTDELTTDEPTTDEPTTDKPTPTRIRELTARDDLIASVCRETRSVPSGGAVVIDSVGPLEATAPPRYRSLLCSLDAAVMNAGGVGLIHALMTDEPRSRCRLLTEQVADVVIRLETTVTDTAVENRLAVPKARGVGALDAPIKLTVTDRIVVDTSRDIA